MLILGIDPGSLKTGYALIEVNGRKINYLRSGVIRFSKTSDFLEKPGEIYKSCIDLLGEFSPDYIAFESLIFVKNISSLAKLAQARGAMLAAFNQTHLKKIFEYSPTLVKSTVAGHGHAGKEQVKKALCLTFGKREFETDDESDALAIALTHAINHNPNSKELLSSKSGGRSLRNVFKDRKL